MTWSFVHIITERNNRSKFQVSSPAVSITSFLVSSSCVVGSCFSIISHVICSKKQIVLNISHKLHNFVPYKLHKESI